MINVDFSSLVYSGAPRIDLGYHAFGPRNAIDISYCSPMRIRQILRAIEGWWDRIRRI
jgi:hypothetical protein